MKNLEERYLSEVQLRTDGDVIKLKFPFMIVDLRNANNRLYPRSVVEKALAEAQKKLAAGQSIYGGDKHPEKDLEVSDVSHVLDRLYFENDVVVAEGRILPTAKGKNLAVIINAGGRIGVSARGLGSTKTEMQEGKSVDVVQPDYIFKSVDFVLSPSFTEMHVGQENIIEELQEGKFDRYSSQELQEEDDDEMTEEEALEILEAMSADLDKAIKAKYGSDHELSDFELEGNHIIIVKKFGDDVVYFRSDYEVSKAGEVELGGGLEQWDSATFPEAPQESTEEQLRIRYQGAQKSAYKGSFQDYKMLNENQTAPARYRQAVLAGFKGSISDYIRKVVKA